MGDRLSEEAVERASEIHVLDYVQQKGESFVKQGRYHRHTKHDSLMIHESGKWFWNSRGKGGFGAISFARTFYGLTFQEAVQEINGLSIETSFTPSDSKEERKDFLYPTHCEVPTHHHIRRYLTEERKLDARLVDDLIQSDYVAEDRLKNCVFKWKNSKGEVVGADRQGTIPTNTRRGSFKQIMPNSQPDGGFRLDRGTPTRIALFESPIDALSYDQLQKPKDIRLFSMSGLKDKSAARAIKELYRECRARGDELERIIVAVDNDPAGNTFAKRWENKLSIVCVHQSKTKDWNQDLKMNGQRQPDYAYER